MKKYDAIIIGSGISGLTAAILLAQKGQSVAVLEKHFKPGGYLHSFKRFGCEFDTGAHYVGAMGEGGPFRNLLENLGVYNDDLFLKMSENDYDRFLYEGEEYSFSQGHDNNIERLIQQFPSEEKAIVSYFNLVKQVAGVFPKYNGKNFDSTEVLKWMGVSLMSVVESLTENKKLKSLLYAYCSLHGTRAEDAPFGAHAVITNTLINGAYFFKKSGDELANAYVKRCKDLGVDIYLSEKVESIEVDGNMATAVFTEKNEFVCQNIISSLHPKVTFSLLSHDPSKAVYKKRMAKMKESCGIVGIYATLKEKPSFDIGCNHYLFSGEGNQDFLNSEDPLNPTMAYICRPGRSHEENYTFKNPCLTIHVPCNFEHVSEWSNSQFGKRPDEYNQFKDVCAENVFQFIDKYHPGLASNIDKYNVSTPLTNIHYNGSAKGTGYGIYHGVDNTGLRGIQPRTKVKNLFLTGQNTSFPGIQSSAESGVRTAMQLIDASEILGKSQENVS